MKEFTENGVIGQEGITDATHTASNYPMHNLVHRTDPPERTVGAAQRMNVNPHDFRDIENDFKIATFFSEMSEICPKEIFKRPYEVLGRMLYGRSVGLNPMESLKSIYFVNGKPCVYGDSLLAICRINREFQQIAETIEQRIFIKHKGAFIDKLTAYGILHEVLVAHDLLDVLDNVIDKFDVKEIIQEALKRKRDVVFPQFEYISMPVAICIVYRKGEDPHTREFSQLDAITARLWGKPGPWSSYPKRMLQMRARSWALRDKFSDNLSGIMAWEEAIDCTPIRADVIADSAATTPEIVLNKLTNRQEDDETESTNYDADEEGPADNGVTPETYFKVIALIKEKGISNFTQQEWLKRLNADSLKYISEAAANKILEHYDK